MFSYFYISNPHLKSLSVIYIHDWREFFWFYVLIENKNIQKKINVIYKNIQVEYKLLLHGKEFHVLYDICTLLFRVTCRMSLVSLVQRTWSSSWWRIPVVVVECNHTWVWCIMNIKNLIVSWIFRILWEAQYFLFTKEFLKDTST